MAFPDLFAGTDTRRCTLVDVRIKRDPDGKSNDDLLFDLHFAHLIAADDHARLDAILPGLSSTIASASAANRRSTRNDSCDVPDRWVSIQEPGTGTHLCWQRRSEVYRLKSKVTGPASTVVLVIRVRGLDATDASRIARLLEREVDVTYQDLNPKLALARPGQPAPAGGGSGASALPGRPLPRHRGWDGTLGVVVVGQYATPDGRRAPVAGIVVSASPQPDGATLLSVEDVTSDSAVFLPASDVESSILVASPNSSVPEALAYYASEAAARGVDASWTHLVTAFGVAYADGTLPASEVGEWLLTPEICEAALDLAGSSVQPQGGVAQA